MTFPGPTLSREAVLRSITIEGARFLRADHKIGSLEKGKLADIIVLDRNFFEVPEEELARQKVLLTMLGGDVQYIAKGAEFGTVQPKFLNTRNAELEAFNMGGFGGKKMSKAARAEMSLRKRGVCDHRH
jgi:urease alpha subunit